MATTNTITYNGLTIGSGTDYGIVEFEGMDSLALSAASLNVSHVDGGAPLTQHLPPRTLRFSVRVPDSGLAAFINAFTRTTTELEMDVVWDGMPTQMIICKVSDRQHVRTRESEFEPRRLFVVEMSSSTGVIRGTWRNVALTEGVLSSALTQLGNTLSYPTIVLTGTDGVMSSVIFTNNTTGESLFLNQVGSLAVDAGVPGLNGSNQLIIDHKPLQRTVLHNGISFYKEVSVSSVFWGINGGDQISFNSIYTAAPPTVTVYWYDFYI